MPDLPHDPKRRAFLGDALKLGASSLLIGSAFNSAAHAGEEPKPLAAKGGLTTGMITRLPDLPVRVLVDHDGTAASHSASTLRTCQTVSM